MLRKVIIYTCGLDTAVACWTRISKLSGKAEVTPVHAIIAYGVWRYSSTYYNLSTTWRWSAMCSGLCTPADRDPQHTLNKSLSGPQTWSKHFLKEKEPKLTQQDKLLHT